MKTYVTNCLVRNQTCGENFLITFNKLITCNIFRLKIGHYYFFSSICTNFLQTYFTFILFTESYYLEGERTGTIEVSSHFLNQQEQSSSSGRFVSPFAEPLSFFFCRDHGHSSKNECAISQRKFIPLNENILKRSLKNSKQYTQNHKISPRKTKMY